MFWNILANQSRSYYFWFSRMFSFLKNKFVTQLLLHAYYLLIYKLAFKWEVCEYLVDYVSYYGIESKQIFMNRYLKPVALLKKETLFQAFSYMFCEFWRKRLFLRLFANYSSNFWITASRFFILEPAFCESDKNHKFDNFKSIPC